MSATSRTFVQRQELGFDRNLSDFQRQVIDDPSRRVLLCMGRRSGKSFAIIVKMLKNVLGKEDALCWYICPSRERAKTILWLPLKRINDQYRLGAKFNDSELTATFKTGSQIRLIGVEDIYHSDRLRGTPADLFAIDEAASYRDVVLRYLVEEAISAAAEDFADAQIWLAGTPGNTSLGYFHDADQRNNALSEWSSYHATVLGNPFFERWRGKPDWQEQARQFLVNLREKKGWSESNPIFQREWLASWQTDSFNFYYSGFHASRNVIPRSVVPEHQKYIIGLDIGHRIDPTVLCVLAYNDQINRNCYAVETMKLEAPTNMEDICEAVRFLDEKYNPEDIVGDYAGGGSFIFEEVSRRFNISIKDAQKKKKAAITEIINSELHEGRVLIAAELTDLISEFQTIRWDYEHKIPDPAYPNDTADAFQYAFSEVNNYLWKPAPPKVSEKERIEQEVASYWEEYDRRQDEQKEIWGFEI